MILHFRFNSDLYNIYIHLLVHCIRHTSNKICKEHILSETCDRLFKNKKCQKIDYKEKLQQTSFSDLAMNEIFRYFYICLIKLPF